MTLNAKIKGFIVFFAISGCDTSLYYLGDGATLRYAMADVCIYMAVNKMLNLIDFNHLQIVFLFVVYSRITTFSSIAGIYYDDKIINVMTPKFWPYVKQVMARQNGFRIAQTFCLLQQELPTTFLKMSTSMTLNDI